MSKWSDEARRARRQAFLAEAEADRASLKHRLELEHGLVQHPKADLLFEIAWEYGHSAGLYEVESYYGRLAELFK